MSPLARPHPTTEGRRGSRIDLEERGRYLNIPRNRSVRAFTSVQGTGCGTVTLKFGLKFLVYYPVITDGLGFLLLMVITWATLERRHVLYVLAMIAAVGTRENLLLLVLFHTLHLVRTGPRRGNAAHATGAGLAYIAVFSWALIAVVAAVCVNDTAQHEAAAPEPG